MSRHGSNGLGSVVATIGLFIVVGGSMGGAVDRSSTLGPPTVAGGALCHTTTAAMNKAPNAASRRSLATMTSPPCLIVRLLSGAYKSQPRRHSVNENLFWPGGPQGGRAPHRPAVRLGSRGLAGTWAAAPDRSTAD